MSVSRQDLTAFLSGRSLDAGVVTIELLQTKGSTPREKGAWMLVDRYAELGTIGGGQLEFICIDTARQMLRNGQSERLLEVPLGPEIGQCCGGWVEIELSRVDTEKKRQLSTRLARSEAQYRQVFIMGAGHVGRALAGALSLLPLKVCVVDSREGALKNLPSNVETRLSLLPEAEVRAAPPGTAFVVLTHDHAEDFMIVREALGRRDASYVGMIGSKTKRVAFVSWLKKEDGPNAPTDKLICPIGDHDFGDKRPEVIGALVAAEILVHTGQPCVGGGKNGQKTAGRVEEHP